MAAAALILAGCTGKTKTLRLADFTVTYPATYEISGTEDNFPDDAAFYFKGEDGEFSMNSVVYYSEAELDFLADKYEKGLTGFIEDKLMELFEKFENGVLFDGIVIDEVSDVEWDDDKLGATIFASGTWEDDDDEWIGGMFIALKGRGALVTCVALGYEAEPTGVLMDVTDQIEFDPRDESYCPTNPVVQDGPEEN